MPLTKMGFDTVLHNTLSFDWDFVEYERGRRWIFDNIALLLHRQLRIVEKVLLVRLSQSFVVDKNLFDKLFSRRGRFFGYEIDGGHVQSLVVVRVVVPGRIVQIRVLFVDRIVEVLG